MDLRHLRYVIAVADEGNFTRAAERLGMAQPPLSRQIRDLEIELGAELFERSKRPIRLTEAGRVFYDQASQVLIGFDQLKRVIRQTAKAGQRRFVIGFVGSVIYGHLPDLIRRFRAAKPTLDVKLIEMTTLQQVDALKDGRIDAGVGRVRVEDPALRRHVVYNEPLIVALPSNHALAQTDEGIPLRLLADEKLIVYPAYPRPSYADQVLRILRDQNVQAATVTEVREVQTALGLVAAEAGIAIVPRALQRLQRSDIVFRNITGSEARSPILLNFRAFDTRSEISVFEELAIEVFESGQAK